MLFRSHFAQHRVIICAFVVVYWKAVSHYKGTNDHTVLGEVPKTLQQKYPNSVWAKKAIPWAA